jgi:23S rRNA pseudouridine1911/1915/1917 synthase
MPEYEIIAETENYLVINKPAGLLTHGAEHIQETSLVDLLLERYPDLNKAGEDPDRPGIVHRLDKQASGLLVIAKTFEFFDYIKKQFQARQTKKEYTVLVHGQISKEEDTIDFPIQRSKKGHKMAALPSTYKGNRTDSGKLAITEFDLIRHYINYSLLKVRIKTGRTHQIRVHMAAYGHPVVGDELYGTKKTKAKNEKLDLGRLFLVADKISFTDLAGKTQAFSIELPKELREFLKTKIK